MRLYKYHWVFYIYAGADTVMTLEHSSAEWLKHTVNERERGERGGRERGRERGGGERERQRERVQLEVLLVSLVSRH